MSALKLLSWFLRLPAYKDYISAYINPIGQAMVPDETGVKYMRANIKDIMKATGCDEATANKVEQKMNEDWLVDWSEDSMSKIHKAAKYALAQLKASGELLNIELLDLIRSEKRYFTKNELVAKTKCTQADIDELVSSGFINFYLFDKTYSAA